MGTVSNLFGQGGEPEPEPEVEFDFSDEHFHLIGWTEDIQAATGPSEVKRLVNEMSEAVKDWPDG